MSALKQFATSSDLPRRRGKSAKTLALEAAIVEIIEERAPITVRGVCYALFVRELIPSMEVGNTQRVSRILTEMRESGAVDWRLIVDDSRKVQRVGVWQDPGAIIEAAIDQYRRDAWAEQAVRVEVWSEKATVQGILAPVLTEFAVPFRVMKGFGSFTSVMSAAEQSDDNTVVLYLGDWDPSGLYMSEVDLPARLERYEFAGEITRIALVDTDLARLPSFAVEDKRKDPRYEWFVRNAASAPGLAWELDAMDPNHLRARVRREVLSYLDTDAWNRSLEIEAAETESMRQYWAAHPCHGGRT